MIKIDKLIEEKLPNVWKNKRGSWSNSFKSGFKTEKEALDHAIKQKEKNKNTSVPLDRLKPNPETYKESNAAPEFEYKADAEAYVKKNGGKVKEFRAFNHRGGKSQLKYKVVKESGPTQEMPEINKKHQKDALKGYGAKEVNSRYKEYFRKLGFVIHQYGFTDFSESLMTIDDARRFAKSQGYKDTKEYTTPGGLETFVYEKPGGPYTDDIFAFDSKNGAYVFNITHKLRTDKS